MTDNAQVKMNVTLPGGEKVGVSVPAHQKYEDLLRDLSRQYGFPEEDYTIWRRRRPVDLARCIGETEPDSTETDGCLKVRVRKRVSLEDLMRDEFILYGCPKATTGKTTMELPDSTTFRVDV